MEPQILRDREKYRMKWWLAGLKTINLVADIMFSSYVYMYVYVYICMYMYVYVCICMQICIYVYIY